jgi:hypothetical protein
MIPEDYLEEVIGEIEEVSCNLDYVCQDWEDADCPDCSNGQ